MNSLQNWLSHRLFLRTRSLFFGLSLPFQSLKLVLSSRKLLVLSLIPILLTITLYTYLIHQAQAYTQNWLSQYLANLGWSPQGWAAGALLLITRLLLILVGALTFSTVAGIAATPFNDILAEQVESLAQPPLEKVRGLQLKAKLKLVLIDLIKSMAAGLMTLAALLLSWIPALNIAAFLLSFLLIAFQYVSYPQTRRGIGLGEGFRFVRDHVFACAGFGAITLGLFAIPVVSSFCLPLAVVGGTLLVARAQKHPDFPPLK